MVWTLVCGVAAAGVIIFVARIVALTAEWLIFGVAAALAIALLCFNPGIFLWIAATAAAYAIAATALVLNSKRSKEPR